MRGRKRKEADYVIPVGYGILHTLPPSPPRPPLTSKQYSIVSLAHGRYIRVCGYKQDTYTLALRPTKWNSDQMTLPRKQKRRV